MNLREFKMKTITNICFYNIFRQCSDNQIKLKERQQQKVKMNSCIFFFWVTAVPSKSLILLTVLFSAVNYLLYSLYYSLLFMCCSWFSLLQFVRYYFYLCPQFLHLQPQVCNRVQTFWNIMKRFCGYQSYY